MDYMIFQLPESSRLNHPEPPVFRQAIVSGLHMKRYF